MKYSTWLRRAGWSLALATIAWGAAATAQDGPPPGDPPPKDGPPPPKDPPPPPGGPEEHVRKIIRRYAAGYHLNMSIAPVPRALDSQLDLKGEGVLVTSVGEDGPAAKAGIEENDIVLAVGDKPIKSHADLLATTKEADGRELSIKLMRGGKPMTVNATPQKSEFTWEEDLKKFKDYNVDV
jgi:membrane-associated protease RseP (regulator of RpoE activity)